MMKGSSAIEKTSTVRKALIGVVIALFAASMLVIVGCSCSATSSSSASSAASSSSSSAADMMTVPNVVSLTQADADKALAAAGFKVGNIDRKASDTVPSGSVISQDPKALTSAKKGTAVNLVISTGKDAPKDVQVPDLKGMTQADAEKALSDVGLVGVASNPEVSTDVAPGQVFKQSVNPGETVKEGTRVAFTVAMAPDQVAVPDVTGMMFEDAKASLSNANLGFDYTVAYNDNVPENRVITQSIAAGTMVASGTTVSVAISLGPTPQADVKVPDVTTYSWSDAEIALTSAGLQARYTGDPAGVVVSQDVAPGTMVAPGTLVTVTLGKPGMVTVPDLVGMSVTSAEIATDQLDLALDIEGGSQHGTVTKQWPEAGKQIPVRSTVHIFVDDSDFR